VRAAPPFFFGRGIAVTAVAILIGWNSPGGVTGGISLILLIGMQRFAARVQGEAVKVHVARGGRPGSNWLLPASAWRGLFRFSALCTPPLPAGVQV